MVSLIALLLWYGQYWWMSGDLERERSTKLNLSKEPIERLRWLHAELTEVFSVLRKHNCGTCA